MILLSSTLVAIFNSLFLFFTNACPIEIAVDECTESDGKCVAIYGNVTAAPDKLSALIDELTVAAGKFMEAAGEHTASADSGVVTAVACMAKVDVQSMSCPTRNIYSRVFNVNQGLTVELGTAVI